MILGNASDCFLIKSTPCPRSHMIISTNIQWNKTEFIIFMTVYNKEAFDPMAVKEKVFSVALGTNLEKLSKVDHTQVRHMR